ncbi:unnamed protein product, partial [Amoebophrya sp. A25]|eukprot:GSA25T00015336001.1
MDEDDEIYDKATLEKHVNSRYAALEDLGALCVRMELDGYKLGKNNRAFCTPGDKELTKGVNKIIMSQTPKEGRKRVSAHLCGPSPSFFRLASDRKKWEPHPQNDIIVANFSGVTLLPYDYNDKHDTAIDNMQQDFCEWSRINVEKCVNAYKDDYGELICRD